MRIPAATPVQVSAGVKRLAVDLDTLAGILRRHYLAAEAQPNEPARIVTHDRVGTPGDGGTDLIVATFDLYDTGQLVTVIARTQEWAWAAIRAGMWSTPS